MNDSWHYKYWKNNRIMRLLCVPDKNFFIEHIVSLFQKGMTLNNYGTKKNNWKFDNIVTLNSAKTIEEVHNLI